MTKKKYVAEKDEDEDNDDELILFSLRSLFASNNDGSKDDFYKKETNKIRNDRARHKVFGTKSRKAGKEDFTTATVYSAPLDRYLQTAKRISDKSLEFAVIYMLNIENVGLWPWERRK